MMPNQESLPISDRPQRAFRVACLRCKSLLVWPYHLDDPSPLRGSG